MFFAILPAGAMSLGLALQSNLAVEFGMNDGEVGALNLWTNIVSAASMVLGRWLSAPPSEPRSSPALSAAPTTR